MAYRRIISSAVALDRDKLAMIRASYPVRNYDASRIRLFGAYLAVQHIRHPGGRLPDPAKPNLIVKTPL